MENRIVDPCDCMNCENRCEFFKRLTKEELEKLNHAKKGFHYRKGETIIKKGGFHPYILLISQGFVKLSVEADHEKCFIMELLGPHSIITGNVFEYNLIQYTVTALTDTVVCHLAANTFIELLESNGRFATDFIRYTNTQAATRFHRLHTITLKQSRGKLADVLLYIWEMSPEREVFRYLSRQDLANMANISMENAIRTLKEFSEEGLITIDKKDINVVNMEGLRKVSRKG